MQLSNFKLVEMWHPHLSDVKYRATVTVDTKTWWKRGTKKTQPIVKYHNKDVWLWANNREEIPYDLIDDIDFAYFQSVNDYLNLTDLIKEPNPEIVWKIYSPLRNVYFKAVQIVSTDDGRERWELIKNQKTIIVAVMHGQVTARTQDKLCYLEPLKAYRANTFIDDGERLSHYNRIIKCFDY